MTDRTLKQALEHVWETDWKHRRSGKCLWSQAVYAINALLAFYPVAADPKPADITQARIQVVTAEWYQAGLSPATITKRLNCLSKLGVDVAGCKPPKAKVLQWWLNPEKFEELRRGLLRGAVKGLDEEQSLLMRHYITWATTTGLRVEETLRLTWGDVHREDKTLRWRVTVPGTKTSAAQATLPLSKWPSAILEARKGDGQGVSGHVFAWHAQAPLTYDELEEMWNCCRRYLCVHLVPGATLKALRRTAARHLHIELGMPLDMVREYLRHENVETTQGYLKLVGGYSAQEMEKFL